MHKLPLLLGIGIVVAGTMVYAGYVFLFSPSVAPPFLSTPSPSLPVTTPRVTDRTNITPSSSPPTTPLPLLLQTPSTTPRGLRCGLSLTVQGGTFSPTTCEFQFVTPGVPCEGPQDMLVACPEYYILQLEDFARGHIRIVSLTGFQRFAKGTYRFVSRSVVGPDYFDATLIESDGHARNLQRGEVTLNPAGNFVGVSLDLSFQTNIRLVGSGTIPIVRRADP